jgi:hypothetical protein
LVPDGDLWKPRRDSEPVVVISGTPWLAMRERDLSLRKLKSISKTRYDQRLRLPISESLSL